MSSLPMAFGAPWYLLLLLLLPVVYWVSRESLAGLSGPRRFFAVAFRLLVLLFLILALAEFRFLKRNESLAVIFVVDRSESIPAEQREAARLFVLEKALERDYIKEDLVGVVAVAKKAGIEWIPKREDLDLESFLTLVEPDGTDLAAGVRLAAAAFPDGVSKRIVLLSDGNQNRGDVLEEVRNVRGQGVAVDVVPITYSYPAEIAVEKLLIDSDVNIGQPFDVHVIVDSTHETEVKIRLFQGDRWIEEPDSVRKLVPGKNRIDFPGLRLDRSGLYVFETRLEPLDIADDSLLQNNSAVGFTEVSGEPRVLVCASEPSEDRALIEVLRAERLEVETVTPATLPRHPAEYMQYDAIVLSNVAAHQLSTGTMELFESLVKAVGMGFVMIGGEESFGAGGYQGTPVERLLPVEMEIKHRKKLPNGALALVVHSCELANGNWWAKKVIERAITILSPRDYVGVLHYVSGTDAWLFPMTPVSERRKMLGLVRGFNPGDMMSFQQIMQMALAGLQKTPASIKHMIILTDGDPQPPSTSLVNAIRGARITISVICYGAHGAIPPAMQQLARAGGGQFHYLKSGEDLPEIFIREAVTITKSLISEEPFQPLAVAWSPILQGLDAGSLPQLDGYVLTTEKPQASVPLVRPAGAEDPTQDPLLATWSYGVGKAVAFTSDAGRRWGKAWAGWSGFGQFWSQCIRWAMRSRSDDRFRLTRSVDGNEGVISIDAITPDGQFVDGIEFEGTVVAPDFETAEVTVRQDAPGHYEARFPADQQGSYAVTFSYEQDGTRVNLSTGLSVPYSPEYRRLETDHDLLKKIAATGGGRYFEDELATAPFFSRDFPVTREVQDVWLNLLVMAVVLFFLDVFMRRVAVDYRALAARAWNGVLQTVGARKRVAVPADSRLGTLLERKAALTEERAKRYRPPVVEVGAAPKSEPAPRWDAAVLSEERQAPRQKDRAAAPDSAVEIADASRDGGGTSYTARLLEAKKRARARGESGESKEPPDD